MKKIISFINNGGKEIMTKGHPRWDEFCKRLKGSEGCNFRYDENGKLIWNCGGGEDKSFAIKILETMPEIDIQRSIEYFETSGGWCDCEIILNVMGLIKFLYTDPSKFII